MLKTKSIKFIILSSLIPILLIGCGGNESSQENPPQNGAESTTIGKNPETQIKSEIQTAYGDLFQKYKSFAGYIYKINEQGKPVNDNNEVIETGGKPALGKFVDTLKEESQKETPPTLIQKGIFQDYYDKFMQLKTTVDEFKGKIETTSIDEEEKQKILDQFKEDGESKAEKKDLWLLNEEAKTIIGYFSDRSLSKEEICELQKTLEIQINNSVVNDSNCGNFGSDTYQELATTLTDKTIQLGQKITQIEPLIPKDTTNTGVNNNKTTEATNSSKGDTPWSLLIICSLGLLTGIMGTSVSIITLLNLLNYEKKTQNENRKLMRMTNEICAEIKELNKNTNMLLENLSVYSDDINRISQLQTQSRFTDADLGTSPETKLRQDTSSSSSPPATYVNDPFPRPNYANPPQRKIGHADLVDSYNQDPRSFLQKGKKFIISKETAGKLWDGSSNNIVNLEPARNGEYLLIQDNNSDYAYVFPEPTTIFNPQIFKIIMKSELFICHGNLTKSVRGQEIEVTKPAKVRQNGQYWTLVESGELVLS